MKLISVVGVKQGVGATTAAIQVAQAIQKKGNRVCLVDADSSQDVGFYMEISATQRTATQLLAHRDRLSGDQVLGYLHQARHQMGGLVLDAAFQEVRPMLLAYDTVIVDGLVADADVVVVVTSPESVMMRAVAPRLSRLSEMLVPVDRVALLVNAWRPYDPQVRSVLSDQYRHLPLFWVTSEWDGVADDLSHYTITSHANIPCVDQALLKKRLLQEFQEKFDLKSVAPSQLREEADRFVRRLIADTPSPEQHGVDCIKLIQEVLDEALGLGLLEPLMSDPSVAEIMVNGRRRIFVERGGKLSEHTVHFENDAQIDQIIERIVTPLGRRVDESSPMVDARLSDGSRVNIVVPPLALDGPTITIRRFSPKRWRLMDLVAMGSVSEEMTTLLKAAIHHRLNIIVSGGTGSGKTTLLNVLSDEIGETERIVTIEDAAELQLRQPHVVRLESRPSNLEGKGAVTIRDLVKNALRMRPNRIIVGECRGGEALDMLQAMNTGHDGSLTTIHANNPRAALSRLETLVLFSGMELPMRAIRDQVASAIDLIVQVSRLPDGMRKIVQISEVTGQQGDVITLQDLATYRNGDFVMGNFRPKFMEGLPLPRWEGVGERVNQ